MDCRKCRECLVDYLYGELPREVGAHVRSHVAECVDCRSELRLLTRTRETLDAWREAPPPAYLGNVSQELAARVPRTRMTFWSRSMASHWVPLATGGLVALLTFVLLQDYVEASPLPTAIHVFLHILWGALFGLLLHLGLRGKSIHDAESPNGWWGLASSRAARGALVSASLGCILVAAVPLPLFFRMTGLVSDSSMAYGLGLLGYSAVAAAGATLAVRPSADGRCRHPMVLAGLYAVVMGPGLAVICVPLTLAVYLAALAGSIAGATLGSFAGLRIRQVLASA